MQARIKAIGNEGFQIAAGRTDVFVDAFYHPALHVGSASCCKPGDVKKADLILVTHSHHDHFDPAQVADVATRTGAAVAGPAGVISALSKKLKRDRLVELEPAQAARGRNAVAVTVDLPAGRVTAFRTFHSPDHNSYLVELNGFRFFHDGDNEDTRRIDAKALGRLDALFICPWQGSGWVEFVEKISPARWILMHLTDDEMDQHRAGRFLPELCDHVPLPERLAAPAPGEKLEMAVSGGEEEA